MKTLHVVAAVIVQDNKILCVQRGEHRFQYLAHKWEFPGGKVEANETREAAIRREIVEELNLNIVPTCLLLTTEHTYPDFHIVLDALLCRDEGDSVELVLREHLAHQWLGAQDLLQLDWAQADIPIVQKIVADQDRLFN